jgi:hypothetical protein
MVEAGRTMDKVTLGLRLFDVATLMDDLLQVVVQRFDNHYSDETKLAEPIF